MTFGRQLSLFFSNKGNICNKDIILEENDKIINDQTEVATTFNNFFINVAKDIGSKDYDNYEENHPIIVKITESKPEIGDLKFSEIDEKYVTKQINKVDIKKATGKDGISPKIFMAGLAIVKPITDLINKTIKTSEFPKKLKEAQVVPCFKKNNTLDKSNYRPVSILPFTSKNFERAIYDQLSVYFNDIFHPSLSAFRSGYGCQAALLKIVKDWKEALDNNKYVAAILMDLSKAFDCFPHNLLIEK